MEPEIRAPIFIVGCHRSGTSIFYQKLALHPDLACITTTTKKISNPVFLMRALMLLRTREQNTTPTGGNVWGRFCRAEDDAMEAADATPAAAAYFRKVVRNHLELFHKPRFLSKSPANSVRISYLHAIFPDAYFVHLVRDGRAVARSILQGRQKKGLHTLQGARFRGWQEIMGLPPLESCAAQWKRTVECIEESAARLPARQYLRVRYEDFMSRPREVTLSLATWCGLPAGEPWLSQVCEGLRSQNRKWKEAFKAEEIEMLNRLLADRLRTFGYGEE